MVLVELTVPNRAEFVSLVRLVVATVAGERYLFDDDQLDGLKLAVSEACVLAVDETENSELSVVCNGGRNRIEITVGAVASDLDDGSTVPTIPLISSLVDDVVVEDADGASRLKMTLLGEPVDAF